MRSTLAALLQWGSAIGSEQGQMLVGEAYEQSDRLLRLVESQLIIAKLETSHFEPSPVPVSLVGALDQVLRVLHNRYGERIRVVRCSLPADLPPAFCEPAHLDQVLANLLGNVRTHTPEGTTATVGLHVDRGTAVLTVTDDGPGIPPALQGHVFERFARGDASRSRGAGSTGLGLAIVEAVIAAHDGTVSLDSRPGYTRFTVRLPGATLGEPMTEDDADQELPAPVRTVIGS
jgi:two-component system OmpR family sensor kinase